MAINLMVASQRWNGFPTVTGACELQLGKRYCRYIRTRCSVLVYRQTNHRETLCRTCSIIKTVSVISSTRRNAVTGMTRIRVFSEKFLTNPTIHRVLAKRFLSFRDTRTTVDEADGVRNETGVCTCASQIILFECRNDRFITCFWNEKYTQTLHVLNYFYRHWRFIFRRC